jgi:hypothetical protein
MIAGILGTVVIALAFAVFLIEPQPVVRHIPPAYMRFDKDPPPPEAPKIPTSVSHPASLGARPVPNIRAQVAGPITLPEIDPSEVETAGLGLGLDGDGIGDEIGDAGPGDDFGPIPRDFGKRCSPDDRLDRLRGAGAPPESEDHLVRALRFLKSTQAADGGWGQKNRPAMTGLALLAYLGHCETALSPEFGESCLRAITYLTDLGLRNDGRLVADTNDRHWPYEHAIATYALAEAESIHRPLGINLPQLRAVVGSAGRVIIDGQHPSGGWDYAYDTAGGRGGDLSITGWQLQALKACKLTGVDFRNLRPCVKRGLEYVGARQAENGGFGYQGTSPAGGAGGVASLTGVGMLSFQIWGEGSASPVRKGERYAAGMKFGWDGPDCDLYAHYYLSQAMFRRGGSAWEKYRPQVFGTLLPSQADDGSWPVPGGGSKPRAVGALFANDTPDGRHYRTVLAALMLEVPYRYLPMSK